MVCGPVNHVDMNKGGAMAFYGLKVATKDIDIILTNQEDLNNLQAALATTGYKEPNPIVITRPYNEMQTCRETLATFKWLPLIRWYEN